jgi:hypothetical protein
MSHDNKIKVKLTDDNLKQNQQEINEYLSYLKKDKTLKQKLASNPTEDDIENLLDPLDIDDILVKPTSDHWIHFSYNYNNIDFAYEQNLLESQGRLQASIRAFHNKSKAYLNVDNSILSISSDSNISITLKQGSPCSLNNIVQLTEQLKEDIYDTLDNLGLIAY